MDDGVTRAELHYKPIGVVAAIGPWNWPMMIAIWQIAPALRAGNTVVVKPSGNTPLSVLALVKVLNEELPEGILSVVSCGRDVGARLTEHPAIGKIMFTGSTAAGRAIIKSTADTVKRLTLELAGNDAGIVLPDADPKAIAQDLFWGAFINTGQTCAALKRLYVHDDIYESVCKELTAVAKAMPVGNGLNENNVLGPPPRRHRCPRGRVPDPGRHSLDQQTRQRRPPHPLRRRQAIRIRPRIRRRRPQTPRRPAGHQRLIPSTSASWCVSSFAP